MRLIDADALIERIDDEIRKAIEREEIYDYMEDDRSHLIAWLQTQPTAYDVDSVIEELEINEEFFRDMDDDFYYEGMHHAFIDAIEIVRRGGVDAQAQ